MDSRTSCMVAPATSRARAEPASRISQARRGLSSYFLRRSCIGLRIFTTVSATQPLHSMQPIPAERQPSYTFAIVSLVLNILCRSPTGHTSGLPGSVRRTRADIGLVDQNIRRLQDGITEKPVGAQVLFLDIFLLLFVGRNSLQPSEGS